MVIRMVLSTKSTKKLIGHLTEKLYGTVSVFFAEMHWFRFKAKTVIYLFEFIFHKIRILGLKIRNL